MPIFLKAYFDVENPKFGPYLRASEGLESLRSRKEKMTTTPNIFGAKIKVRSDFIWEKLIKFLLFNEVLKNLIFSNYQSDPTFGFLTFEYALKN